MCTYKVTVFIPTFNRIDSLKIALNSVLEQGDFVQVHVLDNASTDGTQEWLLEQKSHHSNLTLTLREENIGALENYRSGFSSVKTLFCIPLASDDELVQGFLSKALQIIEMDDSLGAVIFQTECRREGRKSFVNPDFASSGRRNSREHLLDWAKCGHYFSWSSILWRTSLLQTVRADIEFSRFLFSGDAWIQFLCFLRAPVYQVSEPGAVLNMHGQQVSRSMSTDAVKEITTMLEEMECLLRTTNIFKSEEDVSCFMMRLYEHWCQVLSWGFRKSSKQFTDLEIYEAIQEYLTKLYPRIGFKNFALLPMFNEFRQATSEAAAFKLNWMENSLSWKITSPLRRMASWISKKTIQN